MNSVERFDYEMGLCAQHGYKKAAEMLNTTAISLYHRIKSVYPDFKSGRQSNRNGQKWFAEDVALIFEAVTNHVTIKNIAKKYNVSERRIKDIIWKARKEGFNAYPKRGSK